MKTIAAWCVMGMLGASAAAQPVARTPGPPDMKGQPQPQGFSVVLVLGDLSSGSTGDVPPAARKALADMKDFLPFKGYRLLDAEWILGSRGATTRLRGADGQDYELRLTSSGPYLGRLRVTFQLLDATTSDQPLELTMERARTAERAALEQRLRESETELAALRARPGARNEVAEQEARIADMKRRLDMEAPTPMVFSRRRVIDTSFDMEIGETVVVGTSRLKDGKESKDAGRALIALLTAVPKSATSAKEH
ncbi:MAG TPA: hypothetical protein VEU08_23410 [Vicinamibacterales bacterium]|nr:hypothetical protein [Vicinamibacterales bacterium]